MSLYSFVEVCCGLDKQRSFVHKFFRAKGPRALLSAARRIFARYFDPELLYTVQRVYTFTAPAMSYKQISNKPVSIHRNLALDVL